MTQTTTLMDKYAEYLWLIVPVTVVLFILFSA